MLTRRTILAMPLALAACKIRNPVVTLSGTTMGTTYNIVAIDAESALNRDDLKSAVEGALFEVNAQLSNWDPVSEVSTFNRSTATGLIEASDAMRTVVAGAQAVHSASDGVFDITMGPLIEAWGFGATGMAGRTPSDAAIAAAAESVGIDKIALAEGGLTKAAPGTELFLSAIGKGYGVDRLAGALDSLGVENYMVEIGGDLITKGRNADGTPWQIGIETPTVGGGVEQIAAVSGFGMATSGDYRNYFEVDGQRYSHLLDARTGRPITHRTASATVLTNTAMMADAWATAMLILGRERGMEIADKLDLAVLFIDRHGSGATATFKSTPSRRYAELIG